LAPQYAQLHAPRSRGPQRARWSKTFQGSQGHRLCRRDPRLFVAKSIRRRSTFAGRGRRSAIRSISRTTKLGVELLRTKWINLDVIWPPP
jgi:hypothetical protein